MVYRPPRKRRRPLPPGWTRCPLCGQALAGPWTAYTCPRGWLPLDTQLPLDALIDHLRGLGAPE